MIEEAKGYYKFLKSIQNLTFLSVCDSPQVDAILERISHRYFDKWLPLLFKFHENEDDNNNDLNGKHLIAPLDVKWAWHSHLMHPKIYRKDVLNHYKNNFNNIPYQSVLCEYTPRFLRKKSMFNVNDVIEFSKNVWESEYPNEEPYEIDLEIYQYLFVKSQLPKIINLNSIETSIIIKNDDEEKHLCLIKEISEKNKNNSVASDEINTSEVSREDQFSIKKISSTSEVCINPSIDLVTAMKCFWHESYKYSLNHFSDLKFLRLAISRYKKYIALKCKYKNLNYITPTEDMRDINMSIGTVLNYYPLYTINLMVLFHRNSKYPKILRNKTNYICEYLYQVNELSQNQNTESKTENNDYINIHTESITTVEAVSNFSLDTYGNVNTDDVDQDSFSLKNVTFDKYNQRTKLRAITELWNCVYKEPYRIVGAINRGTSSVNRLSQLTETQYEEIKQTLSTYEILNIELLDKRLSNKKYSQDEWKIEKEIDDNIIYSENEKGNGKKLSRSSSLHVQKSSMLLDLLYKSKSQSHLNNSNIIDSRNDFTLSNKSNENVSMLDPSKPGNSSERQQEYWPLINQFKKIVVTIFLKGNNSLYDRTVCRINLKKQKINSDLDTDESLQNNYCWVHNYRQTLPTFQIDSINHASILIKYSFVPGSSNVHIPITHDIPILIPIKYSKLYQPRKTKYNFINEDSCLSDDSYQYHCCFRQKKKKLKYSKINQDSIASHMMKFTKISKSNSFDIHKLFHSFLKKIKFNQNIIYTKLSQYKFRKPKKSYLFVNINLPKSKLVRNYGNKIGKILSIQKNLSFVNVDNNDIPNDDNYKEIPHLINCIQLKLIKSTSIPLHFTVIPGKFECRILNQNNYYVLGPFDVPNIPKALNNTCTIATHKLVTNIASFQCRVIHCVLMRLSVVQIYYKDKMMAIAHTIGSGPLPRPEQVVNEHESITLVKRKGEKAMLIKNNRGDWGIVKAVWHAGRRNASNKKKGYGKLYVEFCNLITNKKYTVNVYESSEIISILRIAGIEINVKSADITIETEKNCIYPTDELESEPITIDDLFNSQKIPTENQTYKHKNQDDLTKMIQQRLCQQNACTNNYDLCERLALAFSISVLYVLCDPQPPRIKHNSQILNTNMQKSRRNNKIQCTSSQIMVPPICTADITLASINNDNLPLPFNLRVDQNLEQSAVVTNISHGMEDMKLIMAGGYMTNVFTYSPEILDEMNENAAMGMERCMEEITPEQLEVGDEAADADEDYWDLLNAEYDSAQGSGFSDAGSSYFGSEFGSDKNSSMDTTNNSSFSS
ncbi:hypothetical protein A3Q56_00641 [Intoshia linei]|uniref:Uncharacterized protein n=1 Tax=Intoshia linei TaxID=1819745 RepID=A0A177BDD9_9BILA|nr:hypothetical protein A3Q56_00641 [Intoshia linei]